MKLPLDLSGAQVIQALARLGFTETRQSGSHVRMVKAILRVTVPKHKAIDPKTLQSILRQANLTLADLLGSL